MKKRDHSPVTFVDKAAAEGWRDRGLQTFFPHTATGKKAHTHSLFVLKKELDMKMKRKKREG